MTLALPVSCPAPAAAASTPVRVQSGSLRGDLDGDGRLERVVIRWAPQAPARCAVLVVAERAQAPPLVARPVLASGWTGPARLVMRGPEPYVARIVRITQRRELVFVVTGHGAHSEYGILLGAVGGSLRVIRGPWIGNSSSVGTGALGWDCAGAGALAETWLGWERGRGFVLRRTIYALRGVRLVRTARIVRSGPSPDAIRGYRLAGRLFDSCTVATYAPR